MAALAHLPETSLAIEAAGQKHRVTVTRLPFSIGRSDQCDAIIPDFRVSRLHARVVLQDGEYFIEDAGSRHGTFVNSVRCERARLADHDEITLGVAGVKLVFLQGRSEGSDSNALLTRLASDTGSTDLEKLRLFLEAARNLGSGLVVEDFFRKMLEYALRITRAQRGFVYLRDPHSGKPALSCGLDSNGVLLGNEAAVSRSVVEEALTTAREFISADTRAESGLAGRQSVFVNELRTLVAIPLRTKRVGGTSSGKPEAEGVLYLDSQLTSHELSGVGTEVLRALADECAAVVESAQLMEAEQAARYYRQELDIAASIQRSLTSETQVRCDFATVLGRSIPCKEVGGDFFDVHVGKDCVSAIVADVSGKGVSAALLASVIHGMFYAQISSGGSLLDAVTGINRFLCSRVAGQKYATALAAQIHRNGRLGIVNCGHVPALLAQGGQVLQVSEGDLPLGLFPDACYHVIERDIAAGARLCILSDGISETENADGSEFGTARIEEALLSENAIENILAALQSFSNGQQAEDDRTVVILEKTV